MKKQNRIVVMHGRVADGAGADEQDVLEEVRQVSAALAALGYEPVPLSLSLDLEAAARKLGDLEPLLVFNLVESIDGRDRFLHLAPTLLDSLGIPYTGTGNQGMYQASNKLLAKRLLAQAGMATPPWSRAEEALASGPDFDPPYIVKSVWDNASLGLDCVLDSRQQLYEYLADRTTTTRLADRFVERYVEGREFNLSLLQSGSQAEVLPPAEMLFVDYPPGMPRIVSYAAKWDPASFEYTHTVRTFDFGAEDRQLIGKLCELALACWQQLGTGGYARVDFRVDGRGTPWILEVNPNPCLSADAGLVAAAFRAGYSYRDLVQRILQPVIERIPSIWPAAEIAAQEIAASLRSGGVRRQT
jgi:D-alanine-D-alanine ligase